MLRLLLHLSYVCSFLLETGCNNKEYRFDSNLKSKLISNILIHEEGKLVNGRKKKKKEIPSTTISSVWRNGSVDNSKPDKVTQKRV